MHGNNRWSQEIKGAGNQQAGRDIINEGDGFRPDPNNPNLIECTQCEYPGVSRTATECPKCGHSFLAERIAREERVREEFNAFWQKAAIVLMVAAYGALHIGIRTGLNIWESLVLMFVALGGLWFVWIWLSTQWECRKARSKRRGGS